MNNKISKTQDSKGMQVNASDIEVGTIIGFGDNHEQYYLVTDVNVHADRYKLIPVDSEGNNSVKNPTELIRSSKFLLDKLNNDRNYKIIDTSDSISNDNVIPAYRYYLYLGFNAELIGEYNSYPECIQALVHRINKPVECCSIIDPDYTIAVTCEYGAYPNIYLRTI